MNKPLRIDLLALGVILLVLEVSRLAIAASDRVSIIVETGGSSAPGVRVEKALPVTAQVEARVQEVPGIAPPSPAVTLPTPTSTPEPTETLRPTPTEIDSYIDGSLRSTPTWNPPTPTAEKSNPKKDKDESDNPPASPSPEESPVAPATEPPVDEPDAMPTQAPPPEGEPLPTEEPPSALPTPAP